MAKAVPHAGDRLLRALSADGTLGVRAVSAPGLVNEAIVRQGASVLAGAALGRALLGTVLLAAGGKDGENVELRLRGDGPLRSVLAMADGLGRARGTVSQPRVELPLRGGSLDFETAFGAGELAVTRLRPGVLRPYTGVVPIVSGGVAKDLALYLTESEQTPSAVGLGILHGEDERVSVACGFILQALPGADDGALARAERNVGRLDGPAEVLAEGAPLEGLVERLLDGLGVRMLDERTPQYFCGCDAERALRATALLGREDLDQAVAEGAPLDVRCDFCGDRYAIDPAEARALLGPAAAPAGERSAQ
jgi:molecular chaperone Hsp33